jgi:hypothetical protein
MPKTTNFPAITNSNDTTRSSMENSSIATTTTIKGATKTTMKNSTKKKK